MTPYFPIILTWIANYTYKGQHRVDIVAGVSYSDDLGKIHQVFEKLFSEDYCIIKEPAPTIAALELADKRVNIAVRPWIKVEGYCNVLFATQEKIKKRLDAEGIVISFPQQDVHIYRTD